MSSYMSDMVVGYSSLSRKVFSFNLLLRDWYLFSSEFFNSRIALLLSSSVVISSGVALARLIPVSRGE